MVLLPFVLTSLLLQEPPAARPGGPAHLIIAATASAAAARPGAKISLFLDIAPRPQIHVYAPGAKDYLPISVVIDRQPVVTVRAPVYPPSQTMTFEGEKIPVYDKPFRIVQEATLARSLKPGGTVTVSGSVKYQACDDKVCFIPETVPVTWTVAVAPARQPSPKPIT
jgi:thioredoxin:protein disulfide reductase